MGGSKGWMRAVGWQHSVDESCWVAAQGGREQFGGGMGGSELLVCSTGRMRPFGWRYGWIRAAGMQHRVDESCWVAVCVDESYWVAVGVDESCWVAAKGG